MIGIKMDRRQLGLACTTGQTDEDDEDGGGTTVSNRHRWHRTKSEMASFWQFSELL
jgi:hypothetical protein